MMLCTEFVAALRILNTSQARFARWIDVNLTTVNRWAVGKAPVPRSIERLVNLLYALNLMLGEDDDFLIVSNEFTFTPWEILGVSEYTAENDKSALRKAYARLMKIYHSDVGGDDEMAKKITVAYGELTKRKVTTK